MSHYTDEGFKTFPSGADIPAFTAVKLNSSKQVIPAAAATDATIGVVHSASKSGDSVAVRLRNADGTSNVTAGGTVAVGDALTVDSSGHAITTTTAGNQVIGYAVEAGVANQVIEFLPTFGKF